MRPTACVAFLPCLRIGPRDEIRFYHRETEAGQDPAGPVGRSPENNIMFPAIGSSGRHGRCESLRDSHVQDVIKSVLHTRSKSSRTRTTHDASKATLARRGVRGGRGWAGLAAARVTNRRRRGELTAATSAYGAHKIPGAAARRGGREHRTAAAPPAALDHHSVLCRDATHDASSVD